MPLRVVEPPASASQSVESTLRSFAAEGRFGTDALRGVASLAPDQLRLAEPHQVFTVGLNELAAGRGAEAARESGWRYLVQHNGQVVASAETAVVPQSQVQAGGETMHTFSRFNEGPFVASTAEAIARARALPLVAQNTFEVRMLNVPGLHLMALWLHRQTPGADLALPLAPAPPNLEPGRAYPLDEFLRILGDMARATPTLTPSDLRGG